jgi:hypothetical protein
MPRSKHTSSKTPRSGAPRGCRGGARERIPTYRLHRSSGNAVVTLNSRDIYLGPHGSAESRAEYNRVVAEWLSNQRQGPPTSSNLTIVELVARYFPHVQSYYRKNGHPTSEVNTVRNALQPLLVSMAIRRPANSAPWHCERCAMQ